MRWLLRLSLLLALVLLLGFLACRLLPERLAVNAPITNSLFGWGAEPPPPESFGGRIRVADGFAVSLYAELPRARFLRPTPSGDLLVSVTREGQIVRLARDADGDGHPDARETLLEGLDRPHGIDLHEGFLYVGEGSAVARVAYDEAAGRVTGPPERIVQGLPDGGNHWTRTVRVGPDGFLYVSVGSSCNVCFEEDERRAALLRFRLDGSEGRVFARGLRNSVGFDWRPASGELFATDNGRDLLGDDVPPCELNRIVAGGDYGWPVAYGDRRIDPDVGAGHESRVAASIPPAHAFGAHTAPLGIVFLEGSSLPAEYRGAALVALHGSWNRTRKQGYEVVSLHWRDDGTIEERPFLTGLLQDEDVIGRPVDVAEAADGTIFVSDDFAGAIYRIEAGAGSATASLAPPGAEAAAARDDTAGTRATEIVDPARTEIVDPLRAERGAAHWEALGCAGCHIPERAEPGVVPVLLGKLRSRYDATQLTAFLAAPTPPMPSVPIDEDARRDLATYLLRRFP